MSRKPRPDRSTSTGQSASATKHSNPPPSARQSSVITGLALLFGLFLGLCLIKFGNPVILDQKIIPPKTFSEALYTAWPTHWANWIFWPLTIISMAAAFITKRDWRWPVPHVLWVLPLLWFGWQLVSARTTVDAALTTTTLCQLGGCVTCYFVGAFLFSNLRARQYLLFGVLAAFVFCLIRAVDQKLFEFPRERQFLLESQQAGWTNLPPDMFADMKHTGIIVNTNGADVLNPAVLAKYDKGRVHGTLVYPNALAGAVLLLWPMALVSVWQATRQLRRVTRSAALGLVSFLGAAALFWSGSKSGWLIALAVGVFWLWRFNWSPRLKQAVIVAIVALGLVSFAVRFHSYFAKGATSVSARFDYWHAAVVVTRQNPFAGTGPGTFQRPYAQLKSPEAEMARLTHNDYLEQFSDSGIIGGLSYAAWIILLLATIGRRLWHSTDGLAFAIFAGLLAWFSQGFLEFSLYVPALAWTAFVLAGIVLTQPVEPRITTSSKSTNGP